MSAEEMLEALLKKLSEPAIPVHVDAWDAATIARYMKRTPDTVRREIIVQPTFPKPMRIPGVGRAHALYKAREVIAWLESQH